MITTIDGNANDEDLALAASTAINSECRATITRRIQTLRMRRTSTLSRRLDHRPALRSNHKRIIPQATRNRTCTINPSSSTSRFLNISLP